MSDVNRILDARIEETIASIKFNPQVTGAEEAGIVGYLNGLKFAKEIVEKNMAQMKDAAIDHTNGLPVYPPFGLTAGELAQAQEEFTKYARSRILSKEAVSYDLATHQRMEELSPEQIIIELRQELADAVNYLAGLDLALQRLKL